MSGVFSVYPEKSFRSSLRTTLLGPRLDDSVIDLKAISTHGINTLSIAVKIASCICFLTVMTALSTALLIALSILL